MLHLNSVKRQFLVVLMPLFLGIIVLLSGIGYYFARESLMESAQDLVKSQSQTISLTLANDVGEKMIRLEELANIKGLAGSSDADKVAVLAAAKSRYKGFDMVAYADLNGKAISDTGQLMDRGDREYIKKVRQTKKGYVSDPGKSGTSGKLITILTQPVFENGQLAGFIYGTIDLSYISELAAKYELDGDSHGYVVDEKGMLIGDAQRPELVGKANNLFFQRNRNHIPMRNRQLLVNNTLQRHTRSRMSLTDQCMTRKSFFPHQISPQISMTNIRIRSETTNALSIRHKNTNIVQHRRLFQKLLVQIQFRMLSGNP